MTCFYINALFYAEDENLQISFRSFESLSRNDQRNCFENYYYNNEKLIIREANWSLLWTQIYVLLIHPHF